jgi:tetrathionate reductase subunit B
VDTSRKNGALSRRDLLKQSTGAVAVAGAAVAAPSASAATPQPKKHYGMLIDARRCYGVHACSVACKAEFDVPLGYNRSWVEYINHCSAPNCVTVCPTGATWKREEDGIVVVDPDICIGCKYCVQACPYDARFPNPETGTAEKCDFCIHRVSQGLEPACVEACPSRARIFGDLNDPDSEISRAIAANPVTVLRPEKGTQPNVFYIAADHTDEHAPRIEGQYVRVETHRRYAERR